MSKRISFRELCEGNGAENAEERQELLEEWAHDSVVPALCSSGCMVEPDGTCQHGHPSVIMAVLGC